MIIKTHHPVKHIFSNLDLALTVKSTRHTAEMKPQMGMKFYLGSA
jgi:hypothetical protein